MFWDGWFLLKSSWTCIYIYAERDSSVVRASDSWSKGPGFESRQERRENFLLQGQLSVLTLISVSVPPPCYRIARKRARSFCQKCRCQVTAKHAYTLPMWFWMKWHCKLVHGWMMYTELAAEQQQQQPKSARLPVHHFGGLLRTIKGYSHSFRITCDMCALSLLKSRE